MVDYAEIICQAVDEIVTKRLESVNYDNTITCSVVDISEAKIGKYTLFALAEISKSLTQTSFNVPTSGVALPY